MSLAFPSSLFFPLFLFLRWAHFIRYIFFFKIILKKSAYGLKRLSVDFDLQSGVHMMFVCVFVSAVYMFKCLCTSTETQGGWWLPITLLLISLRQGHSLNPKLSRWQESPSGPSASHCTAIIVIAAKEAMPELRFSGLHKHSFWQNLSTSPNA